MARALIFLATGLEEVEMLTVVDLLRRADIPVDMVSITGDTAVTGSHGITITADSLLDDVDFEEAEMIILPGGMPGTLNLKSCDKLCEHIKDFDKKGKWLAAVCAAPTVFGGLGLLAGKTATSYPGFEEELSCGRYVETPTAVDGNIITSRGMGTCIEFAGEIISVLRDRKTADEVKKSIIYQS